MGSKMLHLSSVSTRISHFNIHITYNLLSDVSCLKHNVYAPVWEYARDKMPGYGAHIAYITGTAALTCGRKGERSAGPARMRHGASEQADGCVRSNTGCLQLMRLHHGVAYRIMAMAWKSTI